MVCAAVLERDSNQCQAIRMGGECAGPLDVHEIIRRSQWPEGQYVPANCVAVCRRHHDVLTSPTAEERSLAHALGLIGYSYERPDV